MPHIIVTKAFKFAHHGYQVQEFEAGADPIETTDEVADWVVEHKHGKKVKVAAAATSETSADAPADSSAAEA